MKHRIPGGKKAGRPSTEDDQTQGQAEREAEAGVPSDDDTYPVVSSAFITFRKQISAQLAGQALIHHEPYRMSKKYIEVSPSDVIWSNLNLNPYETKVRLVISWGITAALIVFWAIPGQSYIDVYHVSDLDFCLQLPSLVVFRISLPYVPKRLGLLGFVRFLRLLLE